MSILQDCDFLKGPFTYLCNLKVNKIAYKPLLLVLLIIDNFGMRKSRFFIHNSSAKI